ncbi:MAG: hypothetical protein V8T82_05610 [Romboutsia timonensis]
MARIWICSSRLLLCGDIDPWKSFELLETLLKAEKSESTEIPRGLTTKIQKFAKRFTAILLISRKLYK